MLSEEDLWPLREIDGLDSLNLFWLTKSKHTRVL